MKKIKLKSLKFLKHKADSLFSQFIRQRDLHICFTCGKVMNPKESQNGHYVSRNYLFLRYDERNCNCQCVGCNVFRKGNMTVYAVRLEDKYGTGILSVFELSKLNNIGNTRVFLNKIIEKYG